MKGVGTLADSPPARMLSQMAKHRLSNNVGSVKHFLSVPLRALGRARHNAPIGMALRRGTGHDRGGVTEPFDRLGGLLPDGYDDPFTYFQPS